MRLAPAFSGASFVYSSVYSEPSDELSGNYYRLKDVNRKNAWNVFVVFYLVLKVFKRESPDIVISTGALPGLIAVFTAKLFGLTSIWVDSIANSSKLSLSGLIASKFCDHTFTQWPNLVNKKVKCLGRVI